MKTCPYCAEEIQDEAKKCRYCGEWLEDQPDERQESRPDDELPLSRFLSGPHHPPYRALVERHMQQHRTAVLMQAVLKEASDLAPLLDLVTSECNEMTMILVDRVGDQIGRDRDFWATASCKTALDRILSIADWHFGLSGRLAREVNYMKPENQQIGFHIFQIATLSFAYSASTQRAQRKFMGIRKGLFG